MAGSDEDRQAARHLAGQAHRVGRVSGRGPWRVVLRWVTWGRLGRLQSRQAVPRLGTPWQDTLSPLRPGWRQRAAILHGDEAFAVDYRVCRRCRTGWVEEPHTDPRYRRCGLAAAGLAALRAEHPGLAWHTLGRHLSDGRPFWAAVGADTPGGYRPRPVCSHPSR